MTTSMVLLLLAGAVASDAAAQARCPDSPAADQARAVDANAEAEYAAVCRRIFERVADLERSFPSMQGMPSAAHHEYRVSWVLDDPAQPASKLNGQRAVYGEDGYWFGLQFFRGQWRGTAVFLPIEFGDLKLWFDFGHAGNASEIAAIARIVREEHVAYCTKHACASGVERAGQ